jgi:integrase
MAEHALEMKNPFSGLHLDREAGKSKRLPVDDKSLSSIQTLCQQADDEQRWLLALVSDTGMRLAEAAGLARQDIDLSGKIPVVHIRPHSWRRVKTSGSARTIPLVGASLWAAQRVIENGASSQFAFPRYNKTEETNANSASAALNKWLKVKGFDSYTIHSFRHAMRDRLPPVSGKLSAALLFLYFSGGRDRTMTLDIHRSVRLLC